MNPLTEYAWLIAAALFLALEAFGIPGIGMMFAGLAALCIGILIQLEFLSPASYLLQFALWFGITAVMAIILWKPMKKWRSGNGAQFNNMIGDRVKIIEGDLRQGATGKVQWSGTTMLAELTANAQTDVIRQGEEAMIAEVRGNTLLVKPLPQQQQNLKGE